jgi:NADPH:quinone reductase-like Zn-dependent oxidoreductase
VQEKIPEQMRAVVLDSYGDSLPEAIRGLRVRQRPVPAPGKGQVLVRIEASPCNPSDLLLLEGKHGSLKSLPTVPGWEGAGTVVASGGGWLAGLLKGKRVACALQDDRDGTWAEYCVVDAMMCLPLKRRMPIDQAASLIVNPLSAVGLLDTARRDGHRAAVQTAAASQLGRMLLTLARDQNFPLVHVVRREAQVELLRALGAEHVLNSSDADFAERLAGICDRLDATAAFDAVGGELTGTLVQAMPAGSTVYVYGALSEQPCGNINPIELIFRDKSVTGFFLGTWIQRHSALGIIRRANRLQRLLIDNHIGTGIQARLRLEDAVQGLQRYVDHMTDGKVIFLPHGE